MTDAFEKLEETYKVNDEVKKFNRELTDMLNMSNPILGGSEVNKLAGTVNKVAEKITNAESNAQLARESEL